MTAKEQLERYLETMEACTTEGSNEKAIMSVIKPVIMEYVGEIIKEEQDEKN